MNKIALQDLVAEVNHTTGDRETINKVLDVMRDAGLFYGFVKDAVAGDVQISAYSDTKGFAYRIAREPITDMLPVAAPQEKAA